MIPSIFRSKEDGLTLKENAQFFGYVPRQMGSLEEFNTVKSMGDNASLFLLFSLIIPIAFKLFLNIGIIFDLVWDLFNMLQLVANIKNFTTVSNGNLSGRLVVPPCLTVMFQAIDFTVNFKPFENKFVKDQLNKFNFI